MDDADDFGRLMAGLRAGDPAAAEELYTRFGSFVRAVVRRKLHHRLRPRFDSLDFAQDVWASFLAIPPGRYEFATPADLLRFLTRVAENRVAEVFRGRFATQRQDIRREEPIGDEFDDRRDPLAARGPTPSQWAIAGEEWARIVARFPAGHRAILERLREGYTYEDIARMTNFSTSTVNRIVRRLKDLSGL